MQMSPTQPQIMDAAGGKGGGQDLIGLQINAQLRFDRVVFLLTAVEGALFF